uniref:Uncharacterized protein n=1 Tax=Timema bartmani TaxID=61472 RepID=A0A7R9I7X9_9NEOP|nr:unnamed protein product [Timema bartmani]
MASFVLTDNSQLTADGFEKLPDQIMYPYAEPYDLQKHKDYFWLSKMPDIDSTPDGSPPPPWLQCGSVGTLNSVQGTPCQLTRGDEGLITAIYTVHPRQEYLDDRGSRTRVSPDVGEMRQTLDCDLLEHLEYVLDASTVPRPGRRILALRLGRFDHHTDCF